MSGSTFNSGSRQYWEDLAEEVRNGTLAAEDARYPYDKKNRGEKFELFLAEPRQPFWANMIEQFMHQLIRADCGHPCFHCEPDPFKWRTAEELAALRERDIANANARLRAIEWMQQHPMKEAA